LQFQQVFDVRKHSDTGFDSSMRAGRFPGRRDDPGSVFALRAL
jgi:hypothetical protein